MLNAPPAPLFPDGFGASYDGRFRYEDVTQDGRVHVLALPPTLGGLWHAIGAHANARGAARSGIIPILTRLVVTSLDAPVRVDQPYDVRGGFSLARDDGPDETPQRLFMNLWSELRGAAGRMVPREGPGERVAAGRVFAEHVFTRPFAPPEQRRVQRLVGVPKDSEIPGARHAQPAPAEASALPAGASWLDDGAADAAELAFTLDQTDSNQHVNSLVYVRAFLEAGQRRLAELGRPLAVRTRAFEVAYRKPCFAGDRVRVWVRAFAMADGALGAAGQIAAAGDGKPRVHVRAIFGG